nr:MAG TPA: hypothetical protein [Caudoviricetes sp.]
MGLTWLRRLRVVPRPRVFCLLWCAGCRMVVGRRRCWLRFLSCVGGLGRCLCWLTCLTIFR